MSPCQVASKLKHTEIYPVPTDHPRLNHVIYTWDLSSGATIRVLRGGALSWPNKSFLLPPVSHCASCEEDIVTCEWRNPYHKRRSEKWHISSGIIALCVSVAHFSFTLMLCCAPMTDSCFTCKDLSLVGSIRRLSKLKTWEAQGGTGWGMRWAVGRAPLKHVYPLLLIRRCN